MRSILQKDFEDKLRAASNNDVTVLLDTFAVIFGLTASTLLSLVFVPVVYSLMDDLREWLAPKLAKLTSVTAEERAKAE